MLWYEGKGIPFVMPPEDCDALADWMEAAYPDEFCASPSFDPDFVDSLCSSGFIPMATADDEGSEYLIPKLHVERSVMRPGDAAVTRTARRESARYRLEVDGRFAETLASCADVHGDGWLRPPLVSCWIELFESRDRRRSRFSSMELYSDGRLVAGEIGVYVGACYTSLTGYRRESGAGTVQLAAAARYLEAIGAALWDLGMPLDYKLSLGAEVVARAEFIARFREARGREVERAAGPFPARALIDRTIRR
jgi:Leu/Phe-tRNA-protein transferase